MDSNGILFIDDDKIPEQAHKGDLSIRKIHIGKNVSTIGAEAFSMCPNLEAIEVDEDNLRFTSETATCYMLTLIFSANLNGFRLFFRKTGPQKWLFQLAPITLYLRPIRFVSSASGCSTNERPSFCIMSNLFRG